MTSYSLILFCKNYFNRGSNLIYKMESITLVCLDMIYLRIHLNLIKGYSSKNNIGVPLYFNPFGSKLLTLLISNRILHLIKG